ncbi:CBS domain-containing protein [Aquabacterium sp.]|uniref:CBS domain-containing protein n=1 Tax=Aquabacterium sp. TaxID=1872578 RepID=UPI0026185D57|nr:CBS domain-containing protein [Aquabacterium sp.]MDD2977738.1 CBS domain-containing protein [Aquabacterium sp.]
MFYVYSPIGQVFSGTLEQLRKTQSLTPAAKVRAATAVATGLDEDSPGYGSAGTPPGAQQALQAYAPPTRKPLTLVGDVMQRPAHVVRAEASVREAWQILKDNGIGQAPVVDAKGVLVGLVTRAELLPPQWLAPTVDDATTWQTMLSQPVGQVMWSPVPSAHVDTDLRRVASLLLETGLPGLPVTENTGQVIGFVSRSDLLRALATDPPLDLWS